MSITINKNEMKNKVELGQFLMSEKFTTFFPGRLSYFSIYQAKDKRNIKLVKFFGAVLLSDLQWVLEMVNDDNWINQCVAFSIIEGNDNDNEFHGDVAFHTVQFDKGLEKNPVTLNCFRVSGRLCFRVNGYVTLQTLKDIILTGEDFYKDQYRISKKYQNF